MVQLLLKWGANPAAADADGSTPLVAAAFSREPEVVKFLLRRGVYNDENLRKAVLLASIQSHTSVCVAVLRHVAASRPRDLLKTCISLLQPGHSRCVMEAFILADIDAPAGYDEQVAALGREREQVEAVKRGACELFVQSAMHLKRAERLDGRGRRGL